MTRTVYEDIDDFAAALRATSGGFVRTARASANWWIESINLTTVSMQQLQTGGPFTFAGAGIPESVSFKLPLTDPGMAKVDGQSLGPDSFLILHAGNHFVWTGGKTCRWLILTIPSSHTVAAAALGAQESDRGIIGRRIRRGLPEDVKRCINGALATLTAADCTDAQRDAAENDMLGAMAEALNLSVPADPANSIGRPPFSRSEVIAKALGLMAADPSRALVLGDLCQATRVSERALRNIFNEYFGVAPMRLWKARQLHDIRAALKTADPRIDTVIQVAAQFAITDPSLLARNYKAMFGELPSRTLRRTVTTATRPERVGWLQFALRVFFDEKARVDLVPNNCRHRS